MYSNALKSTQKKSSKCRTNNFTPYFRNMSIEYMENMSKDIEITFKVPNVKLGLRFDVTTDYLHYYKGLSENGVCTITISQTKKLHKGSFIFGFSPSDCMTSNLEGQFFGVLHYAYLLDISLEKGNSVVINLPDITDLMLNQNYFFGEYVQILSNGLKWKGEVYKKRK